MRIHSSPSAQPSLLVSFASARTSLLLRSGGVLNELFNRRHLVDIGICRPRIDDRCPRSLPRSHKSFHPQMTKRFPNRMAADRMTAAKFNFGRKQRPDGRPAVLDFL